MDSGKPSSRVSRAWWALAVLALWTAACLWAVPALSNSNSKPADFRKGILAANGEKWLESAELMRKANGEQEENGQLVRISSGHYRPYLPLFHEGVALYKLGRYQEALAVWDKSIELKFVSEHDKEREELVKYRLDCRERLNLD